MYRVLIANSSEVYANALRRRLDQDHSVRIAPDGPSTLAAIGRFRPDVLLLDSALIRTDALSVLRQAVFIPRSVLVSTNYVDTRVMQQLQALGVHRVLVMPSVSTAELYIRSALGAFDSGAAADSLEYRTAVQLHALHFQVHREGYRQLCIAIPMLCRDPSQCLTKMLYPAVAEAMAIPDWRAVEHSIRKAISHAWQYRDNEMWEDLFSGDASTCPSNKQFLLRMVQRLSHDRSD